MAMGARGVPPAVEMRQREVSDRYRASEVVIENNNIIILFP